MRFTRAWSFPSGDTFDIPPIGQLVKRYLRESKVSVDPFARNKRWATYTNDLNPDTEAEYHLDAMDFLSTLKEKGVTADLVIFDPPYSPTQVKECYAGFGMKDPDKGSNSALYARVRRAINDIAELGCVVISCGWSSSGMMTSHQYIFEEILLVCHGQAHNDTIVTVERKLGYQEALL